MTPMRADGMPVVSRRWSIVCWLVIDRICGNADHDRASSRITGPPVPHLTTLPSRSDDSHRQSMGDAMNLRRRDSARRAARVDLLVALRSE
jgi:hypothetical protein